MSVHQLTNQIRAEHFSLFSNNCIMKSLKLKRACIAMGLKARVLVALCIGKRWGLWQLTIHSWCEVGGKLIEVTNLRDKKIFGMDSYKIKHIIGIWI